MHANRICTFLKNAWFQRQGSEVQVILPYCNLMAASILKATCEHTSPQLKFNVQLKLLYIVGLSCHTSAMTNHYIAYHIQNHPSFIQWLCHALWSFDPCFQCHSASSAVLLPMSVHIVWTLSLQNGGKQEVKLQLAKTSDIVTNLM